MIDCGCCGGEHETVAQIRECCAERPAADPSDVAPVPVDMPVATTESSNTAAFAAALCHFWLWPTPVAVSASCHDRSG